MTEEGVYKGEDYYEFVFKVDPLVKDFMLKKAREFKLDGKLTPEYIEKHKISNCAKVNLMSAFLNYVAENNLWEGKDAII